MMQVGSLVVDNYGAEWRFLNLQLSRPKLMSLPQDAQHNFSFVHDVDLFTFIIIIIMFFLSNRLHSSWSGETGLPNHPTVWLSSSPRISYATQLIRLHCPSIATYLSTW